MSIIQASIPLFFFLIGVELVYQRVSGARLVRLNDAISDLSLGTISQLAGVFFKIVTIGLYIWTADRFAIQRFAAVPAWPDADPFHAVSGFPWFGVNTVPLLSWTVVFVLVDYAYYWSHRMSHEVHVLWAGHVVHHSSEEYNLAVALRQTALGGLMTWVFYIPLAVMGVPWQMFVACNAINLVYQFWIHTRAVGRLGWFTEQVLNTPSHHRVHHAVNLKYIDRNYAGVFITWDRVHHTFVQEEEEPVYGLTHPLSSWNPLWANIREFVEIFRIARRTHGWRNKLKVVFGPPSWRPDDVPVAEGPLFTPDNASKFDPAVEGGVTWYAFAQFVITLVAAVEVLAIANAIPLPEAFALAFYVALALTNIGGLLEGERWAYVLEMARLVSLASASATLVVTRTVPLAWSVAALVLFVGSAVWLRAVGGNTKASAR
jgi:sterol desaturase/sphingolipid hydroxylase (fatty acid hydroxylase superfamily)